MLEQQTAAGLIAGVRAAQLVSKVVFLFVSFMIGTLTTTFYIQFYIHSSFPLDSKKNPLPNILSFFFYFLINNSIKSFIYHCINKFETLSSLCKSLFIINNK